MQTNVLLVETLEGAVSVGLPTSPEHLASRSPPPISLPRHNRLQPVGPAPLTSRDTVMLKTHLGAETILALAGPALIVEAAVRPPNGRSARARL